MGRPPSIIKVYVWETLLYLSWTEAIPTQNSLQQGLFIISRSWVVISGEFQVHVCIFLAV